MHDSAPVKYSFILCRYGCLEVVEATRRILGEYSYRLTVRQVYYRLISPPYQLFPNTATNYKTFDKILTKARERKEVDWRKIEDRARSILGGEKNTFDSPEGYVDWLFRELNERYYDKSYWESQSSHASASAKDHAQHPLREGGQAIQVRGLPFEGIQQLHQSHGSSRKVPAIEECCHPSLRRDHDPSGLDM